MKTLSRLSTQAAVVTVLLSSILLLAGCGGGSSLSKPAATTTSSTNPQTGMTTLSGLQNNSWNTCGNCGNSGATGATAGMSVQPNVTSPSESGASANFSIVPAGAYTNAYWWQEHPVVSSQLNALVYEFDIYFPAGAETASQAIEFKVQQQLGGWTYNFAMQANFTSGMWRIFNLAAGGWDATSVPVSRFTSGTWHHILVEAHNDVTAHVVVHDAITVDGVRNVLNVQHNAVQTGASDKFTNSFQLDSNSAGQAYNVYLDEMKVSYR